MTALWLLLYPAAVLVGYGVLRARQGPVPRYLRSLVARLSMALVLLLPVIVGPVWVVIAVLDVPPDYRNGAVTGTLLATGWVVTFILSQYEGARSRNQTRIDVLVALQQEVFSCLERLDALPIRAEAEAVQARIAAGAGDETPYHPLPSTETAPSVFDAVKGDMRVIDPDTLEEVLRFYAAYGHLRVFVEDFRSADFRAMDAERRIAAHMMLTQRREGALVWALRALVSINAALGLSGRMPPRSGLNPEIVP